MAPGQDPAGGRGGPVQVAQSWSGTRQEAGSSGTPVTSVCPGRINRSRHLHQNVPGTDLASNLLRPGGHVRRLAGHVNGPQQAVVHPRAAQVVRLVPSESTLPSHDGGPSTDSPGSDAARVIHSLPNLIGAGLDGREHSDPIVVQHTDVKPYPSPSGLPAKSTCHPGHRAAITTVNEHRCKQGRVQCGSDDLGCGYRPTSGVEQDVAPEKSSPKGMVASVLVGHDEAGSVRTVAAIQLNPSWVPPGRPTPLERSGGIRQFLRMSRPDLPGRAEPDAVGCESPNYLVLAQVP